MSLQNLPLLLLLLSPLNGATQTVCEEKRVSDCEPKIPHREAIQVAVETASPQAHCDDLVAAYSGVRSQIQNLPALKPAPIEWTKFYENHQVLDTSNQMSCVGHSVARALSLTSSNQGRQIEPSAEFLHDVGESYYQALLDGEVSSMFQDMPGREQRSEQMIRILRRYKAAQKAKDAGKPQYGGANVALTLDYAAKSLVPSRATYNQHFQGMTDLSGKKLEIGFMEFPPLKLALQGRVLECYASNKSGKLLENADEFSATGDHLKDFDFSLLDQSLDRGYFPILSINTDALNLPGSGDTISYSPGGKIAHAFVVVNKGTDAKGPYYETMDSWADENMKNRNKKFTMKRYKIYRSNLEKKVIHFALVTQAGPAQAAQVSP